MNVRARLTTFIGTASAALFVIVLASSSNGCSVGEGTGSVSGDLSVTDCWSGAYNLQPDFFAATPSADDDTLTIRVQRGSDYINFSDGIDILVTHVTQVRTTMLNQPLAIALPPSVVPPGVPITPTQNPAFVQLALFLQETCRPETPGLYGMSSVSTSGSNGDGGIICNATTAPPQQCGMNVMPVGTATSTITFSHLFDASLAMGGDPGSLSADERLIEATFDVVLGDPRDECSGGIGPPAPCRGHLTGSFQFYFERGKPAQAFP